MKLVLLVLLTIIVLVSAHNKIEQMSIHDAINVLEIIDKIENSDESFLFQTNFLQATGIEYDPKIKSQIYDVITKNTNNTSFYSKMLGLITFRNIILVVMIFVAIAFIFALLRDVIFALSLYAGLFIYEIILSKTSLYIQGILISFLTLFYKAEHFQNSLVKYFFIFDTVTPLFGCFLFYIVATFIYLDFFDRTKINRTNISRNIGNINNLILKESLVCGIWIISAIYHDNEIIGIFTIIMFFRIYGFIFGCAHNSYYLGFEKKYTHIRCLVLSIFLNIVMIMVKIGFITGGIVRYLNIFSTGIYFWGSIVGSVAFLILSDEYYHFNVFLGEGTMPTYILMQFLMATYTLLMIFIGNILYIRSYQSIGGTFLVLWMLNLERNILQKYRKGSLSALLFVILVNLYLIKEYITWYPEYFIF